MRIELLEFLSNEFEDYFERLIAGKTRFEFTLSSELNTDEYRKHIANRVRKWQPDRRNYKYVSVTTQAPDHLRWCEVASLVLAFRFQLISFDSIQAKKE